MRSFVWMVCLLTQTCVAQTFFPLWPEEGSMPNTKGLSLSHQESRQRVTQVETPGLYGFFPAQEEINGTAVIICPSGGYLKLTYNLGGFQLAKWFNTQGVTAFVLMYRLPSSPDLLDPKTGPIADAQRAMKWVRSQAEAWQLDPTRIGVMGASAGGHLAAHLSNATVDHAVIGDSLDGMDSHPNFQILVSPVISMGRHTHVGSKHALIGEDADTVTIRAYSMETQVSALTPPALLIHAHNDPSVRPQNSVDYYRALLDAGVVASLHIFPQGGHNIGVVRNPGSTALWMEICAAWMKEMDLTGQD
jgi:acetyl esterase/lipase